MEKKKLNNSVDEIIYIKKLMRLNFYNWVIVNYN